MMMVSVKTLRYEEWLGESINMLWYRCPFFGQLLQTLCCNGCLDVIDNMLSIEPRTKRSACKSSHAG